jgi:hypothetical protein
MTNSLLKGNDIGLYVDGIAAIPVVTNCVFWGNSATGIQGINGGSPIVTNSILWENGDDLNNSSATYSDIEDGDAGTGNIQADPLFVDTANGDFHLQPGSPCIDAGDNLAPALPTTDFEGDFRIIGDAVDMGVDEKSEPPIGHWQFDEGSGQVATDSSGNGNNGQLGSTAGADANDPIWVDGISGKALGFDGVDDYVEIPYDPSFNLSSFTLEVWLKFTQNDTYAGIISRPNDGNPTDGYSFFRLVVTGIWPVL